MRVGSQLATRLIAPEMFSKLFADQRMMGSVFSLETIRSCEFSFLFALADCFAVTR